MAVKTKASARGLAGAELDQVPLVQPNLPWNTLEHLHHIAALGRRIQGYVQFMTEVGAFQGASAEAKERSVAEFHRELATMEKQLGRIHDELQLG